MDKHARGRLYIKNAHQYEPGRLHLWTGSTIVAECAGILAPGNAARLKAAWNLCHAVPTPALEGIALADLISDAEARAQSMGPGPSAGAIRAAEIVARGKLGDGRLYTTSHGRLTIEQIAALIDHETRARIMRQRADHS